MAWDPAIHCNHSASGVDLSEAQLLSQEWRVGREGRKAAEARLYRLGADVVASEADVKDKTRAPPGYIRVRFA